MTAALEVNGQSPAVDLRGICPWAVGADDVRYQTHDITTLLTPGKNAFGLLCVKSRHLSFNLGVKCRDCHAMHIT